MSENGKIEVEETKFDENGKKILKNVRIEVDDNGNEC